MGSLQHKDVLHQMFPLLHLLENSADVTETDDTLGGLFIAVCLQTQKDSLYFSGHVGTSLKRRPI